MNEIAVVAMTSVNMIHPGKTQTLPRGVFRPVVPVRDHNLSVRVDAGDHYEYHVVENLGDLFVVRDNKFISKDGGELRARRLA